MESQYSYQRILFPTDFSGTSNDALPPVVELVRACRADLIVLHSFRFIDSLMSLSTVKEAKKILEQNAVNQFRQAEEQYLKGKEISYFFHSEIGFLTDRILSNVQEQRIDLLVLSPSIKAMIEEGFPDLLAAIDCQVIVLPGLATVSDQVNSHP